MEMTVVYQGRNPEGVHSFAVTVPSYREPLLVTASRAGGWRCSLCGTSTCAHVDAAKDFYRKSRAERKAQTNGNANGNGNGIHVPQPKSQASTHGNGNGTHVPQPKMPANGKGDGAHVPQPKSQVPTQITEQAGNSAQDQDLLVVLQRIAAALEKIAGSSSRPSFQEDEGVPTFLLEDYPNFDWGSIGAKVLAQDEAGATVAARDGMRFRRRTNPKFGNDIWFSGKNGGDEYKRLVQFVEPGDVEPLPEKIRQVVKA